MGSRLLQQRLERSSAKESPKIEVFQKIGLEDISKVSLSERLKIRFRKTPDAQPESIPIVPVPKKTFQNRNLPFLKRPPALPRGKFEWRFSLQLPKFLTQPINFPNPFSILRAVARRWVPVVGALVSLVFIASFLTLLYQSDTLREEAKEQAISAQKAIRGHSEVIGDLKRDVAGKQREIEVVHDELVKAQQKIIFLDRIRKDSKKAMVQMKAFYEKKISNMQEMMQIRNRQYQKLEFQVKAMKELLEVQKREFQGKDSPPVKKSETKNKTMKVVMTDPVNRFFVISSGSQEGLERGMPVQLIRSGKTYAQGWVERIYPQYAAAVISDSDRIPEIKNGDEVLVTMDMPAVPMN